MKAGKGFAILFASALAAGGVLLLGPQLSSLAPTPEVEDVPVPIADMPTITVLVPPQEPSPAAQVAMPVRRPLAPLQIRQLTQGKCCAAPWWSEDSTMLHFMDRPPGAGTTSIYGVPMWPPGSPAEVVDTTYSQRAGELPLMVHQDGEYSWVEDTATGDRWPLPTDGNPVKLSPDGMRAVWWDASGGWAHNNTLVKAYGSDIYGFDVRELGGLWGMHVVGFLEDSERVLVLGRSARNRPLFVLATLNVESGEMAQVAAGSWLSEAALSSDGSHVAYMVSLDREVPDNNGVWVVSTDGGEPRKLDFVGAYRWRDGRRLVYIPMELGVDHHTVWQLDVVTGEHTTLVSPLQVPIRVAGNDWSVSPDGGTVAFLSEEDGNIWVIDLP